MSDQKNPRIVLAARPKGAPAPEDFRLELAPAPVPGEGSVLLRTLYLSLDPYMRGMMNERAPAYTRSTRLTVPPGMTSPIASSRRETRASRRATSYSAMPAGRNSR